MTTYPAASRAVAKTPLGQLVAPDQVTLDLYGYVRYVPSPQGILSALRKAGYTKADLYSDVYAEVEYDVECRIDTLS